MKPESPLSHPELRAIEQSLRTGNTSAAARGLARFSDHQHLSPAVDYLTIRLLYRQGRIDTDGATSRLHALLSLGCPCSEAESWLNELESAPEQAAAARPKSQPSQPALDDYDEDNIPTPVPPSGEPWLLHSARQPKAPLPPPAQDPQRPAAPRRYRTFDKLDKVAFIPTNAGRYGGGRTYRPKPSANPEPAVAAVRAPPGVGQSERPGHEDDTLGTANLREQVASAVEAASAGQTDRAQGLLVRLQSSDESPPEVQAARAQLLLALGRPAEAWELASAAMSLADEDDYVRLTYAWSAVRGARARDDEAHLEEARTALASCISAHQPGLRDALAANLEARLGGAQVALRLAQSALRSNAYSEDGLAALAESAGLLGQASRAQTAYEQLVDLYPTSAQHLRPRLRRLGALDEGPLSAESFWPPTEAALLGGAQPTARRILNDIASGLLAQAADPTALQVFERGPLSAAAFLAGAPVFRHFGSFDQSAQSVERIETVLTLIYGVDSQPIDLEESGPLATLCGLYVGQVLCRAYGLVLRGSTLQPAEIECVGGAGNCHPVQRVLHRLSHGKHAPLRASLNRSDSLPTEERRGQPAPAPPPPWGQPPTAVEASRLGRAMAYSPVSLYCAKVLGVRLDFTAGSLSALDSYLELVSAPSGSVDPASSWGHWLTATVGAYLGETLSRVQGAHWVAEGDELCMQRPDGSTLRPLAEVSARLTASSPREPLASCCNG